MSMLFILATFLVVIVGTVPTASAAFVPSSSNSNINLYNYNIKKISSSSSLHATKTARNTASSLLPSVVQNPFEKLPWNVERNEKRKEWKLKLERSKLHRELGIAEDATYEQIVEATDRLIAQAGEDNVKRKIQIEVIKDKILQIRLNERLAGLMSDIVTKDAKSQSDFEQYGNALEDSVAEEQKLKAEKNKDWNAPAWTKGLIVKPDRKQINGQVRLWGILTLIGLAFPPFVQYSNRFTWLVCIAQLSFRGMPKENLEGGGVAMQFGRGPGSKSHIKTAWVIGLLVSFLGGALTYSLMPAWAKGKRMTPFFVYAMRNFIYGVACCYFQPYKK